MDNHNQSRAQKQARALLPEEPKTMLGQPYEADAGSGNNDVPDGSEFVDEIHADNLQDDHLFASAIGELRRIKEVLRLSEKERLEQVQIYLARVFALSMEGKRNPARHQALLIRTKIKFRSDTPHHKQTLRAMQKELGEQPPKGSEHDWSLVLEALEDAQIDENETSVREFLTEPLEIAGEVVRGIEKAKAWVAKSKKINDEKEEKRSAKDAEKHGILNRLTEDSRQRPIGSLEAAEHVELPEGLWISVNEGAEVLLRLRVKPEILNNLIVRYGEKN